MKYLKLISVIILTLSSLCEALDELGVVEMVVKSHHGLIIFGVVQSISAFREAFDEVREV